MQLPRTSLNLKCPAASRVRVANGVTVAVTPQRVHSAFARLLLEPVTVRYVWIFVLLALARPPAGASPAHVTLQPLASITNDRNGNLQKLGVLIDAGRVVGLRFATITGDNANKKDFSIEDMKTGAVLDGNAKHKNLVLRGSIDSSVGNADLVITYLSNVIFGEHKQCRASMVRDQSGQWHIVNNYEHKLVDHLFVKTRVFGISTIQGICPH